VGQPESDWLGNCLLFSGILSFSSDYDSMVKALLGRRRTGGAGWFGAQLLFRNCNRHCCRGLHTEADDTKQSLNSELALDFSGAPLFAMSAKGGCFRVILFPCLVPLALQSDIPIANLEFLLPEIV